MMLQHDFFQVGQKTFEISSFVVLMKLWNSKLMCWTRLSLASNLRLPSMIVWFHCVSFFNSGFPHVWTLCLSLRMPELRGQKSLRILVTWSAHNAFELDSVEQSCYSMYSIQFSKAIVNPIISGFQKKVLPSSSSGEFVISYQLTEYFGWLCYIWTWEVHVNTHISGNMIDVSYKNIMHLKNTTDNWARQYLISNTISNNLLTLFFILNKLFYFFSLIWSLNFVGKQCSLM